MPVPEGLLVRSRKAHKVVPRRLVEDQRLAAVISLPGGVSKPYAGVSTAILLFTKTNSGGTDFVWFYDVDADGWSLDDKRTPLLSDEKLGPIPRGALTADAPAKNHPPGVGGAGGLRGGMAGHDWQGVGDQPESVLLHDGGDKGHGFAGADGVGEVCCPGRDDAPDAPLLVPIKRKGA